MAYLLGSKYCVESLTSDVKDLQAAVGDVCSRVGPVRYPSWKFPDKISSDLDIADLLEDCIYNEDETEDNQVAHIKLFELVIDRMVLLLQSFSQFTDQMLSGASGRPPTANPKAVGNQMSIGLVVKKFWNKMVQLSILLHQLSSENRSKTRSLSKLENINQELQQQTRTLAETFGGPHNPKQTTPQCISSLEDAKKLPLSQRSESKVALDVRSIASQTIETSFVPCDACYQVQLSFRDVGDMVVEVCKAQNLPSAIMKHRQTVSEEVMTAADISRWRKEGEKDLNRIRAHLSNLLAQINPLKSSLDDSKQTCQRLSKNLSDKTALLNKERSERETQVAQYEIKIKNIEKQHRESLKVVQRSFDDLTKGKRKVDEEMITLKQQLLKQHEALKELDIVKKQLQETLAENTSKKNTIVRLESDVKQMSEQLKSTHDELEDVNRKLGKEQAKNRSLEKQGQAMQVKHDVVAQRVDELDQDCLELRDQLAEAEDSKEEVANNLEQAQRELQKLQSDITKERELVESIRKEKTFLESSINDLKTIILSLEEEVKEGKERERLLVQFPERNPSLVPNPAKTGVNEKDMKSQVEANSLRMQVLEEENNLLRKNIAQLLDGREDKKIPAGFQLDGPAIPLWQRNTVQDNHHAEPLNTSSGSHSFNDISPRTQQRNNLFSSSRNILEPIQPSTGSSSGQTENHLRSKRESAKGVAEKLSLKPSSRISSPPKSARRQHSAKDLSGNSSFQAYMKLKKTGSLNSGVGDSKGKHSELPPPRPKQGWNSDAKFNKRPGTGESYTKQNMFICPSCDKMYSTQRDIDIHKSYCYG
ncbi:hypothetical protein HOLleu_09398 [Holothuria leucospilota]|uniref:Coiled-coil domain-containing protein 157 n=1 Tax=Holothuria leucospilota TaxID=206669 RepID=A0A9Q1CCW0_HOLLE|nr:hypothetical protein HOLleu_09398 [Holothuria leucospilota]